jgi:hypothetical protein
MSAEAGGDEMDSVRNYFNTTGFERWKKIYGTTDVHSPPLKLALCVLTRDARRT